jgi:peptide-methionine (S)-S-oxide reductase
MSSFATFGAGCFWGVEETFLSLTGVLKTQVGYSGGRTENPTYNDVCWNETGHAEVVQIEFDPVVISYEKLLDVFFSSHNPTTPNAQGPDVGSQYRSVIFYHSEEQKKCAEERREQETKSGKWNGKSIVTEIVPFEMFYPAEEYHQQYLRKNGQSSCHVSF